MEDAHFGAEILDDLGCCGRKEVITGLLGTFGFYFELLDIVSDWYFLGVLQAFADSGKDGADIVENYFHWFLLFGFLPMAADLHLVTFENVWTYGSQL